MGRETRGLRPKWISERTRKQHRRRMLKLQVSVPSKHALLPWLFLCCHPSQVLRLLVITIQFCFLAHIWEGRKTTQKERSWEEEREKGTKGYEQICPKGIFMHYKEEEKKVPSRDRERRLRMRKGKCKKIHCELIFRSLTFFERFQWII